VVVLDKVRVNAGVLLEVTGIERFEKKAAAVAENLGLYDLPRYWP
jgi:hypothetical protein